MTELDTTRLAWPRRFPIPHQHLVKKEEFRAAVIRCYGLSSRRVRLQPDSMLNMKPESMLNMIVLVSVLLLTRAIAVYAHEWSHALAAQALGHLSPTVTLKFHNGIATGACVVPSTTHAPTHAVRHAGWVASLALAVLASAALYCHAGAEPFSSLDAFAAAGAEPHSSLSAFATAMWWVALDSIASDLLGIVADEHHAPTAKHRFHCGNFGVILLRSTARTHTFQLLRRMLKVTMTRGAQSAGIVTFRRQANGSAMGVRSRVVNGKRSDLADLVLNDFGRRMGYQLSRFASAHPQILQGHTRFATSSVCNLSGCHPHQWMPPRSQAVWHYAGAGRFVTSSANVRASALHGDTTLCC